MKIKEVMTKGVVVVSPESTLQEAAEYMKAADIGSVPVCENQRVVGMLTDRDITITATADGLAPGQTRVSDVMSPDVVFCFEDQDVEEAAQLMEEKEVRRLVVLDDQMKLAGILSIGDLSQRTHNQKLAAEVIQEVSRPPEEAGKGPSPDRRVLQTDRSREPERRQVAYSYGMTGPTED